MGKIRDKYRWAGREGKGQTERAMDTICNERNAQAEGGREGGGTAERGEDTQDKGQNGATEIEREGRRGSSIQREGQSVSLVDGDASCDWLLIHNYYCFFLVPRIRLKFTFFFTTRQKKTKKRKRSNTYQGKHFLEQHTDTQACGYMVQQQ